MSAFEKSLAVVRAGNFKAQAGFETDSVWHPRSPASPGNSSMWQFVFLFRPEDEFDEEHCSYLGLLSYFCHFLCSENAQDIKRVGVYSHKCGLPWCHKPAGQDELPMRVMVRPKQIQLSWLFKRNSSLLLTMFFYRSWDCEKQNLLFHLFKFFPSFSIFHSLTQNSLVSHCRERNCLLLGQILISL